MASRYKDFVKLLNDWPLDTSKAGRDIGQHIRDQIKVAFAKGHLREDIDKEQCDRYYLSLRRLSLNYWGDRYPRKYKTTGSGLSVEECNLILTPEFEEYFKDEELGFIKRNFAKLKRNDAVRGVARKTERAPHTPVMAEEVLKYLEPSPGETFVDMTFGAGGHSQRILDSVPDTKIFALDRDPVAHEHAKSMAERYPGRLVPLLGRFSELPALLKEQKIRANSVDGFLFDLGCSSMQFDVAARGFSLAKTGPLDMRMDGNRCPEQPTAADVLARAPEEDLVRIIKVYGEEKRAKQIARAIVEARYTFRKLRTTEELAKLVECVLDDEEDDPSLVNTDKIGRYAHSATKTFQALRIFVNNELNEINYGIVIARNYLKISGRLITLSFHSLEDTIVKRHLFGNITDNMINSSPLKYSDYNKFYNKIEIDSLTEIPWVMLHQHVVVPGADEVDANPRSRSAKLRALIKVK